MMTIGISYDIRGTAPRTLFDILNTEEDSEGGPILAGGFLNAEYDEYIRPLRVSGSKPRLLS